MRNCSNHRVRLTPDERQSVEQGRRAWEQISQANNQAAAMADRFDRRIKCNGCGRTLYCAEDGGFRGGTVTAHQCDDCYTRLAGGPIYNKRDAIRDRARELRDARIRAEAHFIECVGIAHARTARFRTYRPTTESQQKALETVRAFDGKSWCLVLAGEPGVGKSHLAAARFRRSVRTAMRNGRPLPTFANESDLAARWRAGFRQGPTGADDVLAAYQGERVLYIDDLGLVATTSVGWIAAMGQIIEYRHRHQMATIVTTNLASEEIARIYGPRILSRLATGTCLRIDGPDARMTANRS